MGEVKLSKETVAEAAKASGISVNEYLDKLPSEYYADASKQSGMSNDEYLVKLKEVWGEPIQPQPSVNVPLFGNVTAEQIQSAPTPPAIKQNAVAQEMLANKNIPIVSNALQTQQTTDPNILAAQNVISVQQNNAEKESTYQKELKRQQKELQATKTLARNEFERSKAADATMLDAYKFAESKYMAGDKSPEIVNFLKQNKNAFDNTMKGVDESYKIWGLTHVADKASKEKGIDSKISTLVDEYFAKPIEGEKQRPKAVILGEIHKLNPDFVIDESQSNSEKSAQINELYKDAVIDYQLARREYDKAKAEMDKVVPLAHTTPLVSKLPTEGFFPEVKRFNEAERALGESGDRVKALYKSAVLKEDLGEEYNKYLQNRGVGMKVAENTINPAVAGFASFFNPLTPSGKGEISTTVSGQSEQQKLANVLGEIKGEQANEAEKSASPSFAQNVFKGAGELGGMIAQQAPLMPIGEAVAEPLFAKFVPEAIKGTLAGSIRAGLITAGKDAATFYAASGDPNQAVMGAEYGLATGLGSSLNVLADTNPFIVKLAEKSPFAANIAQVTGKSVVGTGITVSGAEALRLAHAGVDYMVTDDTFKDALTKAGIDPNVSSELNHRIAEMVTLGIVGAPHLFKAINKEEQARLREVAIKAGASPELADAIVANPEESKEKAAQNKDEVVEDILGGLKPNGTEVKKTVVEAQPEAQPTAEVTQEEIPKENDIVSYKLNNKTYKGVLSKNNQGYFIETKNGDIVELGNEIPIDKLQIEEPNIKFVNETDIEVGGRQYKNAESVYDDNGNLRYVKTLDENNNDKLFSGEIAKEIAYNIHLRDLEKLDDNDLNIAYEYATTKNKGTENQGTEKITEGGITKSNELSPQEEERKRLEDEFKVAEEIILDEAKNKLDKQSFVNATDRNGDIKLHEIRTINGKKRVYLNGKEIKQKAHKGRVLKSLSDNGAMNEKAVLKNALKQLEDYKKSELEKLNNQNKQTNEKQEVQIREQQERQGNERDERRNTEREGVRYEANAEAQKEVVEGEATPQQPIEETTEQELNKARLISDKNEREAAIKKILNSDKLKNETATLNKELKNNKTKVPKGEGSWRKLFNDTKDVFRKSDILRAIAETSSDEKELNDIYEAIKGLPQGLQERLYYEVERRKQYIEQEKQSQTKPNENAITKSEQQQQEINQQGGVGEHQGTESERNEAPQSEADNSDSGKRSEEEKTPLTLEERIRKIADDYENNTPEHLKTIITQGVSKDTVIKAMRLIADTIEKGGKAIEAIKAAIRKGVDYITSKHKDVDKKAVEKALTKQIEAEAKAAKQAHIETYDKLKDAFVSRIKEQVDALPTNEAKKEVIKNAVEIIKQNPKFEKTIEGAETSEQDFIDHAEKQLLKEEEPLKPEEEENPQPTEKEKAESMIDQLKNIGKNAEQVESEAVTHRGETGMQVVSEKTKMRTILPLIASDAEQALAKFNDTYKQDYLNKAIDAFLNWNALTGGETKDLTARAAFGIAIENEIRRLQDGTIENKYDLNQRDLETALRRFQPIAAEISQAASATLNAQKNLYNIFDESEAAQEMLSPKEQTLSKDIQETLQNKDKQLDEAAEEFETQPEKPIEQPKEKPKKETKNKPDKRKPKKVSTKEGVDAKAKKKSVLEDLKKELKKLKC